MLPCDVGNGGMKVTLDTVEAICDWLTEEVELRKVACQESLLLCDGTESLWETASASASHLESATWINILAPMCGREKSVTRGFRRKETLLGLAGKSRDKVDTACNHLERQLPRMRNDEYLARGLPIATGVIEGACRHLVKDRLERSGMRWTIARAQPSWTFAASWHVATGFRFSDNTEINGCRNVTATPEPTS